MLRVVTTILVLTCLLQRVQAADCDASVSNNCSCLATHLEHQLGAVRTKLLFETWHQAMGRDEAERHQFFYSQAKEIQATVLAYGQFKAVIAMQCGTLNLPSDGMD